MNNILCELPYTLVHIGPNGEVRSCCSFFCHNYSYGNIFEKPFEEIWNSEKAKEFRKQFFTNSYKYCNLQNCLPYNPHNCNYETTTAQNRPKTVILELDEYCNTQCIFCPHEKVKTKIPIESIESWADDLFKDVESVNPCCSGEALSSPFSRKLIKYLKKFPNLKIELITNGLLFDEANIKELDLEDRLSQVEISFHSLKEKNYNEIVKNSNFKIVMKNVHYAIQLRKEHKIDRLIFNFVITSINYKEMVSFAKFAKKYGANVTFKNCLRLDIPFELYQKINVINPKHKEYNKFIKIISNPIFKEDFVRINQDLFSLKPNKRFFWQ